MKLKILIIFAVCFCFSIFLYAGCYVGHGQAQVQPTQAEPPLSAVKFSLWPNASLPIADPNLKEDWYFLNFGLVTFGEENQVFDGVDAALFLTTTDNVTGLQIAPVNTTKHSSGLGLAMFGNDAVESSSLAQIAMYNSQLKSDGAFQFGVANSVEETKDVFQLGFINRAVKSDPLQIGFLNVNENGFLPVTLFVNF